MKQRLQVIATMIGAVMLLSCVVLNQEVLRGSVELEGVIYLPKDAMLEIRLADVSLADAKMQILSQQSFLSPLRFPMNFEVPYDSKEMRESHTYALSARVVSSQGKLLWITQTRYEVFSTQSRVDDGRNVKQMSLLLKKVD